MSEKAPPAVPTPAGDRLDIVDILRGLALSGVLVGNFAEMPKAVGAVNRATHGFIELFVAGSFYALFAMLFRLGFVLQFARWEARRAPALRCTFDAWQASSCSGWRSGACSTPGGLCCNTP